MPATITDRRDGLTTSVAVKAPCVAVASSNLTLAGEQTIAGVAVVTGDRVLAIGQTDTTENGIYVADTGDWTRARDFDGALDAVQGTLVLVRNQFADGALYELTTANPVNFGSSAITFELRDDPAILYPQTQDEIDAGLVPVNTAYPQGDVLRYGVAADGVTDDTTILQAVLAAGINVHFPNRAFLISGPLAPASNIEITGEGYATHITQVGSATPAIFNLVSKANVRIRNMRLTPQSTGSNRSAIYIQTSTACKVEDVFVIGQTNAIGVLMIDSDYCVVDHLYFNGGVLRRGYAISMGGCKGCRGTNSTAINPDFGFLILGSDIQPLSLRDTDEAFGNCYDNCYVYGSDGHAFDVNSACGNVISNCSAELYLGPGTDPAFQNKHSSNDNSRLNVFVGCTAKQYPYGFDTQQGCNCVFQAISAYECGGGILINDADRCQVNGFVCENFTDYGIILFGSSRFNAFNNVTLITATATAVGIRLDGTGCDSNNFDNIIIPTGTTLAASIQIVLGADNNRFGNGCRVNDNAISDASLNTVWGYRVKTGEISVGATGNVNGDYVHRGMVVAKVRAPITVTISGTPQAQCGQLGTNNSICTAQNVTGVAGAIPVLTQASQLLDPGSILQGRISTSSASGTIFFQYEGIPRL